MKPVTLKNGTQEADVFVSVVTFTLRNLIVNKPFVFYDAVQIARDASYRSEYCDMLRDLNILNRDGKMHDSMRNIILCSVQGDGVGLSLVSPTDE